MLHISVLYDKLNRNNLLPAQSTPKITRHYTKCKSINYRSGYSLARENVFIGDLKQIKGIFSRKSSYTPCSKA